MSQESQNSDDAAPSPERAASQQQQQAPLQRGIMSQLSWSFGRKPVRGDGAASSSSNSNNTGGEPLTSATAASATAMMRQISWKLGLNPMQSRHDDSHADDKSLNSSSAHTNSNHHHHQHQQNYGSDRDGGYDSSSSDVERLVRDQDSSILVLEKTRLEKQQELAALQKELEEERLKQMKDAILHQIETERLQRQTRAVEERLAALEKDMQDKDAIHEYANLIKGVAPKGGVDSQYVMKLQSQLAKAVKKMDATSQQMVMVEQSCEEVVASLKNEISDIVEERCRTELDLRRQLEQLEDHKSDMKAAYEERIRENQREIERLKQRAQREGAPVDVYRELEEAEHRLDALCKNDDATDQLNDGKNESKSDESIGDGAPRANGDAA